MRLVTLEQAREHCRADPADDAMVELYVNAAEDAVEAFLNRKVYASQEELDQAVEDGTAGDMPMVANYAIRVAVLQRAARMYGNREDDLRLPAAMDDAAVRLLWPYRVGLGV